MEHPQFIHVKCKNASDNKDAFLSINVAHVLAIESFTNGAKVFVPIEDMQMYWAYNYDLKNATLVVPDSNESL